MKPARFDVVVIGGGPAGLAAAAVAAQGGARVAIVDGQHEAGGQIYRAAARRAQAGADAEARHGAALAHEAFAHGAQWLGGRSVWQVTPGLQVLVSDGQAVSCVAAQRLIVATGALERPMPIPGWTLPGVMSAGAGQILLKGSRVVPEGDVWLAGSGPLLLLLAVQWLRAGVAIRGVLDTTPRALLVGEDAA
jgi:NADPH-dependent 2,4-dienoyl-CoA reductase/sulfur reductase-like enzyme